MNRNHKITTLAVTTVSLVTGQWGNSNAVDGSGGAYAYHLRETNLANLIRGGAQQGLETNK